MAGLTFSVLVPAYNAEATIEPALRSVLAQTRQDFEVVVVDDGSTDGTAARVEAVGDRRIRLVRGPNRGAAAARNTAIAQARAPLLSLLDGDDLLLPTFLERAAAVLEAAPGAAFAYSDAWLLDDATGRIGRRTAIDVLDPPAEPLPDARALLRELLRRNFLLIYATIRREAIEQVGGFDESLVVAEDYELWLRLAAHGLHGVPTSEPLALYRRRVGSLTRDERQLWRHLALIFTRYAADEAIPPELRAAASSAAARARGEGGGAAAVRRRARLAAGSARRRLVGDTFWLLEPPPAVAAAFPDLRAV